MERPGSHVSGGGAAPGREGAGAPEARAPHGRHSYHKST